MKTLFKLGLIVSVAVFLPLVAFAQVSFTSAASGTCTAGGIGNLICRIQQILNSIIPVLIALGVVYFVWGVVQYVIGDGEEAKKKGRDHIIYGILGFAVIIGLWGLVSLVVSTFGLSSASINLPSLAPIQTSSVGSSCDLGNAPKFQNLLNYGTCVINNSVIPLMFAVAIAAFIWGVLNFFILGANEEAKRSQGRDFIIWGLVALVVMLSIWGLVTILGDTFGLSTNVLPQVKPSGSSSNPSNLPILPPPGIGVLPVGSGPIRPPILPPDRDPFDPFDPFDPCDPSNIDRGLGCGS